MFKRIAAVAIAVAMLGACSMAHAAVYRIDFTFSGFNAVMPGLDPAPYNWASGSAIITAPSPTADWSKLHAFSLTIGDASYNLADAGMVTQYYGNTIGGLVGGQEVLPPETNDFYLLFSPEWGTTLTYSSSAAYGYWQGGAELVTFTELSASPMPEGETYAMLLAGLALLGCLGRRRRA